MTATGSMFRQRQLGRRLERLRRDAKFSQTGVEATGIVSRMQLWRIENGVSATRPGTVKELCDLYGVDRETKEALAALAEAKGSGWFERFGDGVPKRLAIYLGAELTASWIGSYDPEVIPGLLQTPGYASAIFLGEDPDGPEDELQSMLDARLERQRMFWEGRPSGAELCAVLNEAALAREVGGRATMRRQVEHLRELGGQEGVEIRILPWAAGAHRAIYGGFTIFKFDDPLDPTVVHLEGYTGGAYLEEEEDVRRMLDVQFMIYQQSIPVKEYQS